MEIEDGITFLETTPLIPVWVYWIVGALAVVIIFSLLYGMVKRLDGKRTVKRLDKQSDLDAQNAMIQDTRNAVDRYTRVRDEVHAYSTDLHNMVNYPAFNDPKHTTSIRMATILIENETVIDQIEHTILNAKKHRKLLSPEDRATLRNAADLSEELQRTFTELRLDAEASGWTFTDHSDTEQVMKVNQYIAFLNSDHDLSLRRHALYRIHEIMLDMFGAYSLERNAEIFDEVFYGSLIDGFFTAEEFDDYSEAPPTDVEIDDLLEDTPGITQNVPQRETLMNALLRYWQTQDAPLGQTIHQLVVQSGHDLADLDDTTFFQIIIQQEQQSAVRQSHHETAVQDALRDSLNERDR